jgi:imidazole glycerol phosphate synthase glutamine amidotransferase subunit
VSDRPRVAVLALGASNHANICSGLVRAGGDPFAATTARDFDRCDAVVIPGVANVAFVIDALDAAGLRAPLLAAIDRGLPALGVCAGFQLCFERCEEAPQRSALGIFSGSVRELRAPKLPHMGWNRVEARVAGFPSGWAYFAHSFAAPDDSPDAIAVTEHGETFACAARRGNLLGVQFHPERSGAFGAAILAGFVREAGVRC